MTSEQLLEVIGNIDEKLIKEAEPKEQVKKSSLSWMKAASLAACLCVCAAGLLGAAVLLIPKGTKEGAVMEEAVVEESAAEEAVMEEPVAEEAVVEESAAEEVKEEAETPAANGEQEREIPDISKGFVVNGQAYREITVEECKEYGMEAEESVCRVTQEDLGTFLGIVESSEHSGLIGCSVYAFNRYEQEASLCILEADGYYFLCIADDTILP